MALLEVRRVTKRFGGLVAVNEVDLQVNEGEIRGVVGPNGAGKTTLLNLISGFLRPTSGRIIYQGRDITHLRPSALAKIGLVRTFQLQSAFGQFSVLKNVILGCHLHRGDAEVKAMEFLELIGMADVKDELAMNLPHGQQRSLALALALAAEPKLLMLDEPTSGLSWEETSTVMDTVRKVRDLGTTIILVEHHMRVVMGLCDRISVLDFGKKIAEGSPQDIRENKEVHDAYLGGEELISIL